MPDEQLHRLIRWLSLPYGTNVPIFHGEHSDELRATYLSVICGAFNDPALVTAAGEWASRPEPGEPIDWGDAPAELVDIDEHGNTVR